MDPIRLTEIFEDCFSKVRVLRVKKENDALLKFEKLLPTTKKREAGETEKYYKYFQSVEGADMENFEYFTFR